VQPRLQILNSFCLGCYLQSDTSPTLDPRSDFHIYINGLTPPSLIDVSRCSSPDVTWGEAAVELHDASPDLVHDRSKSVSDASQNDPVESAVREVSFVPDTPSDSASSPSLDDESRNQTSISPESQSTTLSQTPNGLMSSKLASPSLRSTVGLVTNSVVPLSLPNGRFKCPKCPRSFHQQREARSVDCNAADLK
jgi:hypothetical protein